MSDIQIATLTPQEVELRQRWEAAANSLIKSATVDIDNVLAVFESAKSISILQSLLTDDLVKTTFMPLMNRKIGFVTDRNGRPNWNGEIKPYYGIDVVRDAIIDAISFGLLPSYNQFNIISERMYPTKEGFTALLKKKEVKYFFSYGADQSKVEGRAEIPVKVDYEWKGEKKSYTYTANVKKDKTSSYDQLKGKAERSAKKHLYEYITGIDFGEADDVEFEDVSEKRPAAARQQIKIEATDAEKSFNQQAQAQPQATAQSAPPKQEQATAQATPPKQEAKQTPPAATQTSAPGF